MRNLRSSAIVLAATFAAGCSGGGANSTPVAPAPAGVHSAAPVTPSANQAAAILKFTIPAGKKGSARTGHRAAGRTSRTPSYVSEASLGAVVTATSTSNAADDEKYGYDLSASGVCDVPESGPETCTLSIPLYADSYAITIALYDQNESGSAASPTGNLLSIDTESETIVLGTTNTLSNFLLHPQVDYFDNGGLSPDLQTFGAAGGTTSSGISYAFNAEDADHYYVDFTGNPATYHNGPLAANAADTGDTTGCSTPCFTATNDIGTSPGATPATISKAADESFTLAYTGGGGPGTGVENSIGGAQPTGQHPYAGTVTAVAADGSGVAQIAPLFAYPTSLSLGAATQYVWAAQYAPPTTANANGTSYSAYFGTFGNTTCSNIGGATVATVGTGTYYAGYGMVFPVTGGAVGTCTLTLSDGGDPVDTVTVPITVSSGGTVVAIPCPGRPGAPTGSAKARKSAMTLRRMASAAVAGPTLVQSVTGTASATLANDVTAGDTLVLIAGDEPGGPTLSNGGTVRVTWNEDDTAEGEEGDMFVYTATVATSGSIGTVYINDACNASFWLGEFGGTSETAIDEANAAGGESTTASSSTTPAIVPNAAGGLVITAADSVADTSAATASSGYTEFFQAGPATSLDVQLAISPTTDTTDPISNTFSPVPFADENVIFQIPPATFTAPQPVTDWHARHVKKRRVPG